MCGHLHLRCLRQKRNSADRWQHAKTHSHPTVNACTTLHMTAKQITVVSTRMKPIDMSCSKNENSAKLMTADIKTVQTRSHKSKFCPVRNRPKLWCFQDWQWACQQKLPRHLKTTNPFQSQLDSSLCTAFCALFCNWWSSLPELSVTTQLANGSKISNVAIYDTCPFKQFSWLPIQTCTGGCHSRRIPKPS